jgi:hypothetical protein
LVFGQLIDCRGHHHRHIFRDVFHARFILLAAGRIERLAFAGRAGNRFEGLAIAEVRRDAVIEQIVNTTTPGELLIMGILR